MKKKLIKKSFCLMSLLLVPATLNISLNPDALSFLGRKHNATQNGEAAETNDFKQYIGFGYNAASGKALHEVDAIKLQNPILDMSSATIQDKITVMNLADSRSMYYNSKYAREISKNYGLSLFGAGGVNKDVISTSINLGERFAQNGTSNWTGISNEEYSYYTIVQSVKPVFLQMTMDEIESSLSETFKADLNSVTNEEQAINLFNKYGTHLLTGYELGGIFEMTNYYATNSNSYVKEENATFKNQIETAMASMAAGNDYSITENFGIKNNNSSAVNAYKCSTYGGAVLDGLSIDQAFSKYQTAVGSGFGYSLWADSINNNQNLTIVGIPQESNMVPLWDLLPITKDSNELKEILVKAYLSLTDTAYSNYLRANPNNVIDEIDNTDKGLQNLTYTDNGHTIARFANDQHVSYKVEPTSNPSEVNAKDFIHMEYNALPYDGQRVKWQVSNPSVCKVVDERNGVFKVANVPSGSNATFNVSLTVNDSVLFTKTFKIVDTEFSGGNGTVENPYIISNSADFVKLTTESKYWTAGTHFKLINDIDLGGTSIESIGNIKDSTIEKFAGTFDGSNYKISNFKFSSTSKEASLFAYNSGTIKNLNVDYNRNPLNINNGSSFVAGIAAYNDSTGKIINCHVSNFNVKYLNKGANGNVINVSNSISGIGNDLYVGGITGYNKGTIKDCGLISSTIDVEAYERVDNLMVGGISGYGKRDAGSSFGSIINCQVERSSFDVDLYKGSYNDAIRVGGLVGKISGDNFEIKNCLIKNMTVNSKGFSLSAKNHSNFSTTLYRYEGGLVGYTENKTKISNCAILGDMKIQDVESYGQYLGVGLVCGQESKNSNEALITSCYIESSNTKAYVFSGDKTKTGATIKAKFSAGDYSPTFNLEPWTIEPTGNLNLRNVAVDLSSLKLDLSNVKTSFIIGEAFNCNGLKVTGLYNDGTEFVADIVNVDASNFIKNLIGTYSINVSVLGKNLTYDVTISDSEDHHIYVKELISSGYYEGSKVLTPENFEVHLVKANGMDTVLDPSQYTYEVPLNGLELGRNNITFTYGEFQDNYEALGIEKQIEGISVLNRDELAKEVYHAGDNEIDFSSVKIAVTLGNGTIEIVNGSDCEFLYSRITEGTNKITVRYKGLYVTTFEVQGSFFVEQTVIDDFIASVNDINLDGTLQEQFEAINLAKTKLDAIDYRYEGSAEYQAAKATLNNAIETFNDLIGSINGSVEESTKIAETFNVQVTTAVATGFSLLALIIGLIVKKI